MAGRKSYWEDVIEPRLNIIGAWCRDGLTDKEIAQKLNIGLSTLMKHKKKRLELRNVLKVNKEIADLEVENALRKRALGYEYTETSEEKITDKHGNIIKFKRKETIKQVLPDVTAQIFWLKNRQHEKWRDKKHTELSGSKEAPLKIERIIIDPENTD